MYPQDSDKIKLLSSIILQLALLVFLYYFVYNAQKSKGDYEIPHFYYFQCH